MRQRDPVRFCPMENAPPHQLPRPANGDRKIGILQPFPVTVVSRFAD